MRFIMDSKLLETTQENLAKSSFIEANCMVQKKADFAASLFRL
jgi:hypothetical protein